MKLVIAGAFVTVAIALAAITTSCSINHRSDQYACTVNTDCTGGRVCENGYCVFEYHAIRDLMWMDDKMRPSFDNVVAIMGATEGSPWGRFTDEQMIALPDREHRLLRDTFAKKFTPRYANQMRRLQTSLRLRF